MAAVHLSHIGVEKPSSRHAGKLHAILKDVSLEIEDGELLVLIGPSGCGKSTLLRCIAGLEAPSQGEIVIDGRIVNELPPRERDIAMVFQSYALYPHMTVFDNLAFGLRMRKFNKAEIARRVAETAKMLEIGSLLERYPRELSGGQRQRVAMGRAVVRKPRLFLFDEPLSNLDAALRQQMRVELLRLHRELRATTVYVTHDQVEAMTLAQRIAVIKQGELVQVGTPIELYNRPTNTFVARFFGTPEMNLVEGQIKEAAFWADGDDHPFAATPGYPKGPAIFGLRAEHLLVQSKDAQEGEAGGEAALVPLLGRVDVIENLGSEALVHVRVGKRSLVSRAPFTTELPALGSLVTLRIAAQRFHLFERPPNGGDKDGARLAARS